MNEPHSFIDPSQYPIVFKNRQQESIMYGQNVFPITFKMNPRPRHSDILTLASDVKGVLFTDRDTGNDPSVGEFSKDTTHRFELYLDSLDATNFNSFIQIRVAGDTPIILSPGNIAHIKQASSLSDIYHLFSMEPSTQLLDPVSGLYPTASLDLSFSSIIRGGTNNWSPISLPDKSETLVLLKPAIISGILDIVAELKLNWYEDQLRTIAYDGAPPLSRGDMFGIRFYITNFGLFSNKVQILEDGSSVVNDVPPQSYLDKTGFPEIQVMYFGGGTRVNDLFSGIETGIEIDESGLPLQLGSVVPAYILNNELDDIESSSMSSINSSSTSSENTSSSSSSSSISSESSPSSSSASSLSTNSSSISSSYSSLSSSSSVSSSMSTGSSESSISSSMSTESSKSSSDSSISTESSDSSISSSISTESSSVSTESSVSSSSSSIGVIEEIVTFEFTSAPYLEATTIHDNLSVTEVVTNTGGAIETNITTGTYFPNEPYIEETGGWTATDQASAKCFQFEIIPDAGYGVSITNISFRTYATSAGPEVMGIDINSGSWTYSVSQPSALLITTNQIVSNVEKETGAVMIKIQGWLDGSRGSSGSGTFRLDDIIITGAVKAMHGRSSESSESSI